MGTLNDVEGSVQLTSSLS